MRYLLSFAFFLIFVAWPPGCANANEPIIQHISTEDGLSQRSIVDIYQDDRGFLWISSINGVDLYDGYRFKGIDGTAKQIINSATSTVRQRTENLIWLSVDGVGLIELDIRSGQTKILIDSDSLAYGEFFVEYFDHVNGGQWLVTSNAVYQFRNQQLRRISGLNTILAEAQVSGGEQALSINSVTKINDTTMLLATNIGVIVFDSVAARFSRLMPAHQQTPEVTKILALEQGFLVIHGRGKIVAYQDINDNEPRLLGDLEQSVISVTRHNESLFLATQTAVFRWQMAEKRFTSLFSLSEQFPDIGARLSVLHMSSEGKLWMGTQADGIFVWDSQLLPFTHYTENSHGLRRDDIWALYADQEYPWVWIGSSDGLDRLDYQSQQIQHFPLGDEESNRNRSRYRGQSQINFVYQIIGRIDREIWLTTARGLLSVNIDDGDVSIPEVDQQTLALLNRAYESVHLDDDNMLWLSRGPELWRYDIAGKQLDMAFKLEPEQHESFHSILGTPVNPNQLLLSTASRLYIYRINEKTISEFYHHPNELADNVFVFFESAVFDPQQNYLWLSYVDSGIYALDADTGELRERFEPGTHGIDTNAYQLQAADDDSLWFSSHKGIYRLDKHSKHVRRFGVNQGLVAEEYNAFASTVLSNGEILFGSMSGITRFQPQALPEDVRKPSITVTEVDTNEQSILDGLYTERDIRLSLEHDNSAIRVEVSALTFDHENTQYQYTLSGKEAFSLPLTKRNDINISHLSPGKNILTIRAFSMTNGYFSEAISVTFEVAPPFYLTTIAYGFYVVTLLALILAAWYIASRTLLMSHSQLAYRENRLRMALEGSNSEVWEWFSRTDEMTAKRIPNSEQNKHKATLADYLALIHPQDISDYRRSWRRIINSDQDDELFSCHYRLRSAEGGWTWYRDLGKIVKRDADGKPLLIAGAYTNINEVEANKEKALLYAEALRQSQDWVLIMDSHMRTITANSAFCRAFDMPDDGQPFSPLQLNFHSEKMTYYRNIIRSLKVGAHWRGEDVLFTLAGEKYCVLVNITVSVNVTTKQTYYLIVVTDITVRKQAEDELRYLANYDTLTNLPNRKFFVERINQLTTKYQDDEDKYFAVLFIDLDHFKDVNDTLGHNEGDSLLREAAKRLCGELRVNDIVARFGGDEFIVLLQDYDSKAHLEQIIQRINTMLERPIVLSQGETDISASIGIAQFPADGSSAESLLKRADLAMYHAKRKSRGTYQFFDRQMDDALNQKIALSKALECAVKESQFINYYQPIIDSKSGRVEGVELLLRWDHQDKLQSIGPYITAVEEMGLIELLTSQRMVQAFNELSACYAVNDQLYLSVNIAASHFNNLSLVDFTRELLKTHNIPASKLRYEITENALIDDGELVSEVMNGLSKLGIQIALDDFGTGFSSLSYLRQLPVDVIKIDRTFVSGIGHSSADEAIIDATIALAEVLGLSCIAEGVEQQHELDYLQTRNCMRVQGYLYARPQPIEQLLAFLRGRV